MTIPRVNRRRATVHVLNIPSALLRLELLALDCLFTGLDKQLAVHDEETSSRLLRDVFCLGFERV